MIKELKEKAYAKVNFNLEVLPKREDGFHPIKSIFQTIDLFDELLIISDSQLKSGECRVVCDSMILPEKNTLTFAYDAFCQIVDVEVPGIRVNLKKGIPSGGGLGGGSSDAAALIRGLEKICKVKLTDEQLDFIAAKTGSDVFFFMHCDENGSGCALVSGRGEIIKKIEPRKDLFLVLIFPDVSSSTKEAYEMIDQKFLEMINDGNSNYVKYSSLEGLEKIYRLNPKEWTFINTFTPVLCSKHAVVNKAIEALKNRGADFTDMSGSGSTVFGVYTLEQQAITVGNLLGESFNCKPVHLI